MIKVTLKSKISNRVIESSFTARQLLETNEEEMVFFLSSCECEPIGETNVVECNCEDEWQDYELKIGEEIER